MSTHGSEAGGDALDRALEVARTNVVEAASRQQAGGLGGLRAGIAEAGLTWTLLGHVSVPESGDESAKIRARFELAHLESGESRVEEVMTPLATVSASPKAIEAALDTLSEHALRRLLGLPRPDGAGPELHFQRTTPIPRIED